MYLYVTNVLMNSSMDRPALEPGVILPVVPRGVPPIRAGKKLCCTLYTPRATPRTPDAVH